jgi:hypothetical protein
MTDEKPNLKEYPDFTEFRSKKKFKTVVSACLIEGLVLVHYRFRATANCIKKMSLESFNKRFYEA